MFKICCQLILIWGSAFPENLEQSTVEHCAFVIDTFFYCSYSVNDYGITSIQFVKL